MCQYASFPLNLLNIPDVFMLKKNWRVLEVIMAVLYRCAWSSGGVSVFVCLQ